MQIEFKNSIYKCTVCQANLICDGKKYVCIKNHSFDMSVNGYVNLLLPNDKKTKNPDDNDDMISCRRNFLAGGFYSKFSDKLNDVVYSNLGNEHNCILDAGCGEGYYLDRLKNYYISKNSKCSNIYFGTDISKCAIKYASKKYPNINFAIGSNFKLPIIDNSCDCIIRNFAPGNFEEFYRVLKTNGKLIIATPGENHLFELKNKLYEIARKNEDINNLITMAPYFWTIKKEKRCEVSKLSDLSITVDFSINVFEKV